MEGNPRVKYCDLVQTMSQGIISPRESNRNVYKEQAHWQQGHEKGRLSHPLLPKELDSHTKRSVSLWN